MRTVYMLLALFLPCVSLFADNVDVHEKVFTTVYQTGLWGKNKEGEGTSGSGSSFENAKPYIDFVQEFLRTKNIKSVVDAGCGDWEFSKYINWSGITYYGFDVVKSVIERNIKLYATENIHFFAKNFLTCDLPAADLLVCKDVLIHLSNADIFSFLKQLNKFKYCLLTNDFNPAWSAQNTDIPVVNGYHRALDLGKPPYNVAGSVVLAYTTKERGIIIPWNQKHVFLIDNSKK